MGRGLGLLLALLLIVPAVAAYAFAATSEEEYGARAEIVFQGGDTEVAQRAEQQLATQRVILSGRSLLVPTAEEFGLPVEDLEDALTVERVADSEVLEVTIADEDPEEARRLVQALVDRYVATVSVESTTSDEQRDLLASDLAELEERRSEAEARVAELDEQRAAVEAFGGDAAVTAEQRQLESELGIIAERMGDLQSQLTQLQLDELADEDDEAAAFVLTPAYVLEDPLAPQPLRAAAAGVLVGLVLGGAAYVWVAWSRGRT